MTNSSREHKSGARVFVYGAAILTLAGIVSKILGMLYRVPMSNILTPEGMGIYQMAYPIYQALVAISTGGMTAAISRLVAARLSHGDAIGARSVFLVARKVLFWLGVITTLLMMAGAKLMAWSLGDAEVWPTIIALAPSLIFVAIICSYRGYFQGMQQMVPTATSQIIEQGIQMLVGLVLIKLFIHKGVIFAATLALAAVSVGEAVAMLYMMRTHKKRKGLIDQQIAEQENPPDETNRQLRSRLYAVAIPITLGALLLPSVYAIDNLIVNNILRHVLHYSKEFARELYGLLTNDAQTLVNMPAVFTVALSMSLVPAISAAMHRKDRHELCHRVQMGMKLSLLTALPAMMGLMLLAPSFMGLLYSHHTVQQLDTGANLTIILAPSILFLALMQTGNGILLGMGRVLTPVKNLLAGAVVKIVWNVWLISRPQYHIYGAALATTACYATVAILNLRDIKRFGRGAIKFRVSDWARPLLASLGMAVCVWISNYFLNQLTSSLAIITVSSVLVGGISYILLITMLGVLTEDDLDMIPGGRKLRFLVRKKS